MIKSSTKNGIIYSLVGVIIVFALWFLLYIVVANAHFIPSPLQVIKASFLNLLSLEFYGRLLNTLLRVLLALIISFILGVGLAVLSSLNAKFEGVMLRNYYFYNYFFYFMHNCCTYFRKRTC